MNTDKRISPDRLGDWLHSFDTGMSSKAIFHYMTLGLRGGATPSDSDDLGRCVRLLEAFPEWLPRMPEMSCVSDDWAALMSIWDDLVTAYHRDLSNDDSERVFESYEMLRKLWWEESESGFLRRREHGFTANPPTGSSTKAMENDDVRYD